MRPHGLSHAYPEVTTKFFDLFQTTYEDPNTSQVYGHTATTRDSLYNYSAAVSRYFDIDFITNTNFAYSLGPSPDIGHWLYKNNDTANVPAPAPLFLISFGLLAIRLFSIRKKA